MSHYNENKRENAEKALLVTSQLFGRGRVGSSARQQSDPVSKQAEFSKSDSSQRSRPLARVGSRVLLHMVIIASFKVHSTVLDRPKTAVVLMC